MPATNNQASITHAGETLRFAGVLTRANIAPLWRQLPKSIDGLRRFDLQAVERVDSAGLALLALLATRSGAIEIAGTPVGYVELCAAYRLNGGLAFTRD